MRAVLLALLAAGAVAQTSPQAEEEDLRALLRQAEEAYQRRDYPQAASVFAAGLAKARQQGSRNGEAYALHGLGRIDNARGDFARARANLTLALNLFLLNPKFGIEQARVRNDLGYTEWATGGQAAALRLYEEALGGFRAAGDKEAVAKGLYNLAFMTRPSETRLRRIAEAYLAAKEAGRSVLAGKSLHLWGDTLYALGDMRGALEKLHDALPLLASAADRGDRARVLISLGRLHATHFRPEAALPYFEMALAIHRELGEKQAIVQALNSLAAAYRGLNDYERAEKAGSEAVRIARETTSKSLMAGTLINHARLLLARREDQQALEMLREAARLHPAGVGREYLYLADAQQRLGRPAEALQAAGTAIEKARRANDPSFQAGALYRRARALDATGGAAEAVADVRAALALVEKLRAQAGPTDFLKRGYADAWKDLIGFAVELFFRQGLPEEALEAAEQGRARAFLDLLATRSLAESVERPQADGAVEPHLASLASIAPANAAAVRGAARSTGSTILTYWLGPEAIFIWAASPQGGVNAVRVPVKTGMLDDLVRRAAQPMLSTAAPVPQLTTRGGGRLPPVAGGADPRLELYRLLVAPVARFLPRPASALTIVPHGALHRLSFSSLRDERGRYLLEDYVVSYLPSAVAADRTAAPAGQGYLFVADPQSLPPGPGGQALPALPGARRESDLGARALRGAAVKLLAGADANEAAVRRSVSGPRVLHFATHGLLHDQRPFDSFLALGRRSAAPEDDGRLTVREIYDLKLQAELVVLSACRTADGPVTGDGIHGMTRAFLYAGARGVVATLWDVADEPTQRLAARFYVYLGQGMPASSALRRAQLDLLAALRKGQVRVQTPLGAVVLKENPAFWAGFVLVRLPS